MSITSEIPGREYVSHDSEQELAWLQLACYDLGASNERLVSPVVSNNVGEHFSGQSEHPYFGVLGQTVELVSESEIEHAMLLMGEYLEDNQVLGPGGLGFKPMDIPRSAAEAAELFRRTVDVNNLDKAEAREILRFSRPLLPVSVIFEVFGSSIALAEAYLADDTAEQSSIVETVNEGTQAGEDPVTTDPTSGTEVVAAQTEHGQAVTEFLNAGADLHAASMAGVVAASLNKSPGYTPLPVNPENGLSGVFVGPLPGNRPGEQVTYFVPQPLPSELLQPGESRKPKMDIPAFNRVNRRRALYRFAGRIENVIVAMFKDSEPDVLITVQPATNEQKTAEAKGPVDDKSDDTSHGSEPKPEPSGSATLADHPTTTQSKIKWSRRHAIGNGLRYLVHRRRPMAGLSYVDGFRALISEPEELKNRRQRSNSTAGSNGAPKSGTGGKPEGSKLPDEKRPLRVLPGPVLPFATGAIVEGKFVRYTSADQRRKALSNSGS